MSGQNSPKFPIPHSEEKMRTALQSIADGMTLAAISRQLEVDRKTLRQWRDSPAGQEIIADILLARREKNKRKRDAAEAILEESVIPSFQTMRALLHSPDAAIRLQAARFLITTGGFGEIRVQVNQPADLSKLTDDELVAYATLRAKIEGGGS